MGRSMLLLVSGFVIIFGIVQRSTHSRQQVLQQRAPDYYYQEQSRYIAGGMMEMALGNLNSGTTYLTPNNIDGIEVDMLGGTGTITVDSTTNFQSRIHTTVSGIFEKPDGTTTRTEIKANFKRDAFSIYAYFTDVEPTIWFTTGDVLNGPVHTNGTFHIRGTPVFNGPITSHGGVIKKSNANATYNGGKNFEANKVKLPEEVPEVVNLAKKENGGIGQFDEEITVEFRKNSSRRNDDDDEDEDDDDDDGDEDDDDEDDDDDDNIIPNKNNDGTVEITFKNGNKKVYRLSEFNGVISSKKKVKVKGVVDGQVTVHSEKDVEVIGDLVYENRNYNDKNKIISDDRLGLISEGETIVDRDAHAEDSYGNNSGKDLYIDASILTLGKRFHVQDYNRGGHKGKLHILGGLIQRERGYVANLKWNGDIRNGYAKDYQYDTRFLTGSTPGFPRKKKFDIETWRESTQTIPSSASSEN